MPLFKRRDLKELRTIEIMLSSKISRLKKEIEELEEKKRKIFREGIGSSILKKRVLATEILGIEMEQKLKLRDLRAAKTRYTLIRSYLSLKDHQSLEKELDKIDKLLKSEKMDKRFERELIKSSVKEDKASEALDVISNLIEKQALESEAERKIIDVWTKVEAGLMSPEEAEKKIALRELKESESKGD
ncbi:MAG: hypothetical protein DRJ41_04525 [Thermoprotei archaeon]|nr:MAG: hypothetical protein DRJ41_04525 [Thermoprotei archaeon]